MYGCMYRWGKYPVASRKNHCVSSGWSMFNPLMPVPAVTGHLEHWSFFHIWYHHLWPKLTSLVLRFCKRERSFQWSCVDTQITVIGSLDPEICTKMLTNLNEKLGAKFPCWVRLATLWRGLLISVMLRSISWTGSKPSRKSNTAAKR